MQILSFDFLYALGAIALINLVLSGDNAIVIALAARTLPKAIQKKAIVWGSVGAIVVRVIMTMVVVWLLRLPGLHFLGGLMLVWIAYQLLAAEDSEQDHEVAGDGAVTTGTLWGALRTIMVADMVMGLDNVLGVAGAAKGSYLLVVLGLALSIPIIIWGSTIILRWVERFPVIIYAGAAVLAVTAASMICHEPLAEPTLRQQVWLAPAIYVIILVGVLGGGWWTKKARA